MENGSVRVLLVEDNDFDALLIQKILGRVPQPSFQIVRASRLAICLSLLGEHQIDAVILDLVLPDSQGLETFRQVYGQAPQVPIVVLTMLDDENAALEAVKEGAQDFLYKSELRGELLARSILYAIERKKIRLQLSKTIRDLQGALAKVKSLTGILPICSHCKRIRDDKGRWNQVESYLKRHSHAEFTHSLCPGCYRELYPEYYYKYK